MQLSALFKTVSASALAVLLAACCGQKDHAAPAQTPVPAPAQAAEKKEIVIGTTVGDFGDMVKDQIEPALKEKGYNVKLVEFTDYIRPNQALAEGELDINVFQHKPYLDDFKKAHNLDLTEVFQVPTAPLGLYPGKLKSLDEVKAGSTVSAPNDPSNFARALVMLDELGWIKLKEGINPLTASKDDIADNLKEIKIVELEAAQLPRSREDVDFAVVNGNYAMSSGMKLTEALFQEPSFAYINWAAVRTADKDSQWLKDVSEAYQSDAFKAYARERFAGYKFPAAWGSGSAAAPAASAAGTADKDDKAEVVYNTETGGAVFYFATGKSDVAEEAAETVSGLIQAGKDGKKLVVSGFTDSTGNTAANEALSKKRAEAVQAFLEAHGVDARNIELRKPDNTTGAAGDNVRGRRVEVKIEG